MSKRQYVGVYGEWDLGLNWDGFAGVYEKEYFDTVKKQQILEQINEAGIEDDQEPFTSWEEAKESGLVTEVTDVPDVEAPE